MRRLLLLLSLASIAAPALAADEPSFSRTEDVIYGRKFGTALTLDVFKPKKDPKGVGLIFVVSGGWFSNHDGMPIGFVEPFTKRGYTVFAVVHGSQPKFTIPEILPDMNRAVRFIRTHAGEYGIDPDRLGIFGASAGGHLSLMQGTAGDLGNPAAKDPVDRASSRVQAVACFYPPTDFLNYGKPGEEAIGRGVLKDYAAPFDFHDFDPSKRAFVVVADEAKIKEIARVISPINHVSADDAPTLIVHGDVDKLVPIQQAEIIVDKLKAAGVDAKLVVHPGGAHGWPSQGAYLEKFADWFDDHLKPKADASTPKALMAPEAKDHIGELAVVTMTVLASKNAVHHDEYYLDSAADFHDPKCFTAALTYEDAKRFKARGIDDPSVFYKGRTIRVTGKIIREEDQTRIRLTDPGQIVVVEPKASSEAK